MEPAPRFQAEIDNSRRLLASRNLSESSPTERDVLIFSGLPAVDGLACKQIKAIPVYPSIMLCYVESAYRK